MDAAGVIELVAAIGAAVGGLLVLARRIAPASGALLIATAVAIPFAQTDPSTAPLPLTLTLLFGSGVPALAGTAAVLWPVSRVVLVDRVAAVLALGCTLLLGGLLPSLLYDPRLDGCNACAQNLLELHPDIASAVSLYRIGAASALIWGPALVLIAARRLLTASPLARRQAWPVLSGAAIAALEFVAAVRSLTLPAAIVDPVHDGLRLIELLLVVAISLWSVLRVYQVATTGRRMARLVVSALPDEEIIVTSLRAAVADPSIDVRYLRTDGTAITQDGAGATRWDGPALRLTRDGAVFAEVRHGRLSVGSTELLRSSVASAALALEYLAAQARVRAGLRDAADVRARLVTAGSAERHRLERNLHDGAQQRLVGLGVMLTAASTSTGTPLEREHAEIDVALQELRTIARGLFPAGLAESGLQTSLRELGDHTRCPLLLAGDLSEPVPLDVKMAAYQLVSDVADGHPANFPLEIELSGGGAQPATITVTTSLRDDVALRSRIANAEDRFVAARGGLAVHAVAGMLIVEGRAPCES